MRDQLENLMRVSEVTRLAVSIVENGQLSSTYLLGQLENEPIRADTIWTVASLTKPVFVYGVMLLVQRGLINLDQPMQDYLPHPYTDEPFLPHMTVRHAMSHATGFPNWRDTHGLRAAFVPGTRFSYSSEGLTYLQQVVEHLVQMPLAVYLHQQVFKPLGMDHTELKSETKSDLPPMLHFLSGSLLANGALSLRTTIEDYARFMVAMVAKPPSAALLNSAMLHEMLRPQLAVADVPQLHWGLGWGLQNVSADPSFWHWGARSIPTTMCFALGRPHPRNAIVIFTDHAHGLYLCKSIIETWLGTATLPAFEWLLPAHRWRPDGKHRDTD